MMILSQTDRISKVEKQDIEGGEQIAQGYNNSFACE